MLDICLTYYICQKNKIIVLNLITSLTSYDFYPVYQTVTKLFSSVVLYLQFLKNILYMIACCIQAVKKKHLYSC